MYENMDPDFAAFMKRADDVVTKITQCFGVDDFADACWRDLFDDLGEDCEDEDIIECLSEADDLFARFVALRGEAS